MSIYRALFLFFAGTTCASALTLYNQQGRPYQYHCPPACHYYYGYNFPASMFDYEVDNACVDFCLDKRHSLQHCTHVCSNYTRPYDYPRESGKIPSHS
jgi:hypothetical protein